MWTDVLDLLERESELGTRVKLGAVDEKARMLIERARRRGWQRVSLATRGGKDVAVDIDGSGRFRYRHLTSYGAISNSRIRSRLMSVSSFAVPRWILLAWLT